MSRRLFKRRGNLSIMPEVVKEPKVKKETAPKAPKAEKTKAEVKPTTEETKEETTATAEV